MHDLREAIHYPGAVEINAGRLFVLQRVEARAIGKNGLGKLQSITAQDFEQRVPRRNPFQAVLFGHSAVGGEASVPIGQLGQPPIGLLLKAPQAAGRGASVKGVLQ